ncbi:MAG: hypothetical protein KJ060_20055 [Candidatus Hydrogenedentes bacterium]|nr:hypothetical protein [Candidatus Hydrogenedentota bacterium]
MGERTIRLGDIAHARSGDKGSSATLGVFAYTETGYRFLSEHLTEAVMAAYFRPMGCDSVERYEVPKLQTLNFVLNEILTGGGSRSLRIDAQGKAIGQIALEMTLEISDEILTRYVPAKGPIE